MTDPVTGFSKKTKEEKLSWLAETYLADAPHALSILKSYWLGDEKAQQLHDDFIENSLTNYILPFGIAPNFSINGELMVIPMVIEESSVVASS